MKSLVASVFAIALLAPAAHAGTYVGLGIGTGAHTDGGLGNFNSDGDHSGRLVIGDRWGMIAVEGGLNYFGLAHGATQWDAVSVGVAAKIELPFTPVFDGYVRLGVEKTQLSSDGLNSLDASGWTDGLGLEYRFASFGVFADYSKHTISFTDNKYDGAAAMFTVGATFGI